MSGGAASPTTPCWVPSPATVPDAAAASTGVVAWALTNSGNLEDVLVAGRGFGQCGRGGRRSRGRRAAASVATIASVSLAFEWVGRSIVGQKIVKALSRDCRSAAGHAPAICLAVAIVALSLDERRLRGRCHGPRLRRGLGRRSSRSRIFGRSRGAIPHRGFLLAAGRSARHRGALGVVARLVPGPWGGVRRTSFACPATSAVFLLAGMLLGAGSGRSALAGIAAGLVAVGLIAVASRLLGIGAGDAQLVASFPSSGGRLSYPIGYWNALGSMVAMAVAAARLARRGDPRPRRSALVLAGFVPVLLADLHDVVSRRADRRRARRRGRDRRDPASAAGPRRALGRRRWRPSRRGRRDRRDRASSIHPAPDRVRPELAVCRRACLVGVAFAALVGPVAVERLGARRFRRMRMRHVLVAASIALLAVLLVLVGPGEIAGDFAATSDGPGGDRIRDPTELSVTGSGRAQFWGSGTRCIRRREPVRGIGTGGYDVYWNQHGGLETPVQNAHSEPLELLAEVGLVGLLAFVAFFARRSRSPGFAALADARRGSRPGPCSGLLATGLVGLLIDWTWDLPAVVVPILVAAAILCTRALRPAEDATSPAAGLDRLPGVRSAPAPAFALVVVVLGGPGRLGRQACSRRRPIASRRAMTRSPAASSNEAAQAARSAAAIEPWAAEAVAPARDGRAGRRETSTPPGTQRRASDRAAPRGLPLLAACLEPRGGAREQRRAVAAYAGRALILAPLVLPRASIEPGLGAGLRYGP